MLLKSMGVNERLKHKFSLSHYNPWDLSTETSLVEKSKVFTLILLGRFAYRNLIRQSKPGRQRTLFYGKFLLFSLDGAETNEVFLLQNLTSSGL